MVFLNSDLELVRLIEKTTTVKVAIEPLSESVALLCHKCEGTVRDFAVFQERCIENDIVLRNMETVLPDINLIKCDAVSITVALSLDEDDNSVQLDNYDSSCDPVTNVQEFDESSQSLQESLKEQTTIAEDDTDKPFHCQNCSKSFRFKFQLETHQCTTQTAEDPPSLTTKDAPKKQHYPRPYRRIKTLHDYECKICGKLYYSKQNVQRHERIHTGERPFICNVCGRSFADFTNLTAHGRIHTGEKPFQCDICSRAFAQKNAMLAHKRTHTGEKPRQCKLCGKRYRENSALRKHMHVHTGLKPFECNVCGKRFAEKNYLVLHRIIHTNERPFQCEKCGRAFNRRSNMATHSRLYCNAVGIERDGAGTGTPTEVSDEYVS